jgi:hypothetical protein
LFSKSILPAKRRIDKGLNGVVGNFAVLCEKPLNKKQEDEMLAKMLFFQILANIAVVAYVPLFKGTQNCGKLSGCLMG